MRLFATTPPLSLVLALSLAGCHGSDPRNDLRNMLPDGGTADGGEPGGPTPPVVMAPVPVPPTAEPAPVDGNPTAPDGLGWTAAPAMGAVQFVPNRDSAKVILPPVAHAADYRVIVLGPSTKVSAAGSGEKIGGTTIFCAGYLQRNTSTNTRELLNVVEVAGLSGPTRVVIEAIDSACPFTGVIGSAHSDLLRTANENAEIEAADAATYSIYTEAEVVAAYGATVFNGQGRAAQTGKPAPATAPTVLARTTVTLTPSGNGAAPTATFFDDFAVAQQPRQISDGNTCYPSAGCNHPFIDIFQNDKWTFHAAGMDLKQYFIDRGQLHSVMADGGADDFASSVMYPRTLAHVGATGYLHVTWEVNSHTSDRRYWWTSVCGADQAGKTIAADGQPTSFQNPDSGLQLGDGPNPNQSGFNCVMIFPKDGNPVFSLPLGDGTEAPPETDARVLVYKSGTGVTGVRVAPDVYHNGFIPNSWFRMLDGKGNIVGPMLDANNVAAPTTRFDAYIRRGRVVLFADGQQKLCNDFAPSLVTMSEAMVGFGQVLYHTSAEHNEMAPDDKGLTHMHHVYENLKYFDRRDWDNLGFEDNVQPKGLDESACYLSAAQ